MGGVPMEEYTRKMKDSKELLDKITDFLNGLKFNDNQSLDSVNCEYITDSSVKVDKLVFDGIKVEMSNGVLTLSQKSPNSKRFEFDRRKTEALEKIATSMEIDSDNDAWLKFDNEMEAWEAFKSLKNLGHHVNISGKSIQVRVGTKNI